MKKMDETKCPFQKGKAVIICEACELMVPSIEEMKKYCEGDFHECPYYYYREAHPGGTSTRAGAVP